MLSGFFKHFFILLGLALVCIFFSFSVYCLIDINNMNKVTSETVGTLNYEIYEQEEILLENLADFNLTINDAGIYTYSRNIDKIDYNGLINDYELLINDSPLYSVEYAAGAIKGVFMQDYKDTDNDILSTVELNIVINFYESGTEITFSLDPADNELDYIDSYVYNNGLILKLLEVQND